MARGMLLYKRTRTTVKKWGDIFVNKIKQVLRADKTYASGRTLGALEGALKVNGNIIRYEISSRKASNSDYSVLEIIDKGRRPWKATSCTGYHVLDGEEGRTT